MNGKLNNYLRELVSHHNKWMQLQREAEPVSNGNWGRGSSLVMVMYRQHRARHDWSTVSSVTTIATIVTNPVTQILFNSPEQNIFYNSVKYFCPVTTVDHWNSLVQSQLKKWKQEEELINLTSLSQNRLSSASSVIVQGVHNKTDPVTWLVKICQDNSQDQGCLGSKCFSDTNIFYSRLLKIIGSMELVHVAVLLGVIFQGNVLRLSSSQQSENDAENLKLYQLGAPGLTLKNWIKNKWWSNRVKLWNNALHCVLKLVTQIKDTLDELTMLTYPETIVSPPELSWIRTEIE